MVYTVKDYCIVHESNMINLDMSPLGERGLRHGSGCVFFPLFLFQGDFRFHQQNPIGDHLRNPLLCNICALTPQVVKVNK